MRSESNGAAIPLARPCVCVALLVACGDAPASLTITLHHVCVPGVLPCAAGTCAIVSPPIMIGSRAYGVCAG